MSSDLNKMNLLFFKVLPVLKLENCRKLSTIQKPYHILENCFDLNYDQAVNYVQKHKLMDRDADVIKQSIEYCKKLGYSNEDILKNPILLRSNSNKLQHQYLTLTEGGFDRITPTVLAKFLTYTNRKISYLKSLNMIKSQTNVYENFLKHIQPLPENFSLKLYGDDEIWKQLRYRLLIKYLATILQTNYHKIMIMLDECRGIKLKSFQVICKNIEVLRELGFTNEKILVFPYVLSATPQNVDELFEKCPTLLGNDIKEMIKSYPKLFCTTPESINKVYDTLKKFGITDEAILKNPNIFYMSSETIEYRLDELQRVPEFRVLLHSPWILKLVLHQNRAKSRLDFLKKLHLKCNGITLLIDIKENFDVYIREGRDKNSYYDVLMYLNGAFNINDDKRLTEIFEKLRKHKYYLQVPLLTIQDTFNYLIREQKFLQSSVLDTVWILLYPRQYIRRAFKQIYRLYGINDRITQTKKLNLALYFIEKEHNFTGNGIWLIKNELQEDEN